MANKLISLDGEWNFSLDRDDRGLSEEWFKKGSFPDRAIVPGSWQAQGFGGELKHLVTQLGHPALQVERHGYLGTAWYSRAFRAPEKRKGQRVWIRIGGVHPRAEFWCNGRYLGKDPGGFLEFKYDITEKLHTGGDNVITARVFENNRDWNLAIEGGVYNSNTFWSGLYRGVSLVTTGEAWIDNVSIFPNLKERKARFIVYAGCGKLSGRTVKICISIKAPDGRTAAETTERACFTGKTAKTKAEIPLSGIRPWSPESPQLYEARVKLVHGEEILDEATERFGMRDIEVRGRKLVLNGYPVFLRGFGYSLFFPRTLSPDLDKKFIRKQFLTARKFGFNGIDVYGVPYREFLDAADETGIMLQVFPGDLKGDGLSRKPHLEALMRQVINHPSIVCYGWSAEIYHNEPRFVKKIDNLYKFSKDIDPTRLVLGRDGSHMDNCGYGKTDFEEMSCSFRTCYRDKQLRQCTDKPVVIHEVGWFSSYPNPRLKKKYKNTPLLPFHITYAEEVAKRQGVSGLLPLFVRNSERLQAMERKLVLEKIRKVPLVSGFHLWKGHDAVSAVEGVWDDFGDPKNVPPEEFCKYNGETVLLMEQDFRGRAAWVVPPDDEPTENPHDIIRDAQGRNLWDGETLKLDILASHYGRETIRDGTLTWELTAEPSNKRLAGGRIAGVKVRRFTVSRLTEVQVRIPRLQNATKMVIRSKLKAGNINVENSWDFWGFPRENCVDPGSITDTYVWGEQSSREYGRMLEQTPVVSEPSFVASLPAVHAGNPIITGAEPPGRSLIISRNVLSNGLLNYLEAGGRVWLMTERLFPEYFHRSRSIPWHQNPFGNSGIIVRSHPVLEKFPHEGFGDLQLYDLTRTTTGKSLELGGVINLDIWPSRIDPIIRSIDSYMGARKRGLLFEARVGKGRLMISRLNFVETPAARFLASEILRYIQGQGFEPRAKVPGPFLRNFVQRRG